MLGKKIRHTKRYQEIVNVFMKNGFSHFLFRIGVADRGLAQGMETTELNTNLKSIGKRLRQALQDLGPTFIKLGQIASTRHDALPPEITTELEKLQDDAPIIPFEHVKQIIETELEGELESLFEFIDPEPLATASIGQVHTAKLFTGDEVVVKVQRPGLRPKMETDLEILHGIGRILEERTAWAKRYRVRGIINEFSSSLRNELDYLMEGRSGERISDEFEHQVHIQVPEIYWEFTTKKVITMEKINGIKISEAERLEALGYNRKVIAKRLADAMLKQIMEHGFFHADPHSGNIFILPKNTIAFLDFGEVGQISEKLKRNFASLIVNLHKGDTQAMVKTFSKMDLIPEETDVEALKRDLEQLHGSYENVMLKDLSLGRIIIEVFNVAYYHHIEIPSDMAILSKVILTLEGVLGRLDPEFSIMRATEPFARKLLRQKYHPKTMLKSALNELVEDVDIITDLPKDVKDVMSVIKKGKIGLDINIRQSDRIMHRLDRISNRISFSILMLAFSILMAGLIVGFAILGQNTMIWELPIIEIGAIVAGLMFVLMVITIIRSGRM
ncbi:ABC1 kinase family protein [Virgibacillus kekensis]|uniref:ABC1 kinase family protein n=1 Tax=Virgibacillus kekensis TaxID=202261 RepID=A0ABV9DNL6_9BACI